MWSAIEELLNHVAWARFPLWKMAFRTNNDDKPASRIPA